MKIATIHTEVFKYNGVEGMKLSAFVQIWNKDEVMSKVFDNLSLTQYTRFQNLQNYLIAQEMFRQSNNNGPDEMVNGTPVWH